MRAARRKRLRDRSHPKLPKATSPQLIEQIGTGRRILQRDLHGCSAAAQLPGSTIGPSRVTDDLDMRYRRACRSWGGREQASVLVGQLGLRSELEANRPHHRSPRRHLRRSKSSPTPQGRRTRNPYREPAARIGHSLGDELTLGTCGCAEHPVNTTSSSTSTRTVARRPSGITLTCSPPRRFQPLQLTSTPCKPGWQHPSHRDHLMQATGAPTEEAVMGFLEVIAHAKIGLPRIEIWLLTTASHDHSRSRDEDQQP
jgi:hypothetical protein